jgi:phosphoribosylpyrophosphate synthetase
LSEEQKQPSAISTLSLPADNNNNNNQTVIDSYENDDSSSASLTPRRDMIVSAPVTPPPTTSTTSTTYTTATTTTTTGPSSSLLYQPAPSHPYHLQQPPPSLPLSSSSSSTTLSYHSYPTYHHQHPTPLHHPHSIIHQRILTSPSPSLYTIPSTTMMTTTTVSEEWEHYFKKNHTIKYQIIAAPTMELMAESIVTSNPYRFLYHRTKWGKFSDGTDNIEIGGFHPINRISGENILMLASFHNNDVTLSQFSVMITLLQSFIQSLTVVLPFYPVGTMERVVQEGQVATANTYAQMFSHLPSCGKPTRLIVYDLHTLQNRFYLHGNAIPSLQTSIPLLIQRIANTTNINCIAFPDDGAAKRFASFFMNHRDTMNMEMVTCGKTRDGDKRIVIIQDGQPYEKNVLIVDDLVQTGGTLYECGIALKKAGAKTVSAFVAHAVFPNESYKKFCFTGERACFEKFFVTNSIPTVVQKLPTQDVFEVLDLRDKIIEDLDRYS